MRRLVMGLAAILGLLGSGCYSTSFVMLRNPNHVQELRGVPLDSEWATLEDTLRADAEIELDRVGSMPPGEVDEQPGGGWIYQMTESGRSRIERIFYDGGKELSLSGYLREGSTLHLLKAGDYSYSTGEIEISRIDSVEVQQRYFRQPKPAVLAVFTVFAAGVVYYLIDADNEMQELR